METVTDVAPDTGMTTTTRILPGCAESAGAAREFTARCLPGCPSADDAVLCVDELVANSVL